MTEPSVDEQLADTFSRGAPGAATKPGHEDAAREDAAIAAQFAAQDQVPLVFPDDERRGGYSLVKNTDVSRALIQGARLASSEEVAATEKRRAEKERYGGGLGQTVASSAGAMRGIVPFGLTDEFLGGVGGLAAPFTGRSFEEERQATLKDLAGSQRVNPKLSLGSEMAGMGLTLGSAGPVNTAARGSSIAQVGRALTLPAEGISVLGHGAGALAQKGAGKLVGKAASKIAGIAAQGATEGLVYGESGTVDESILGDRELAAEKAFANGGHGAIFGTGLGLGLGALGGAAGKVGEKVSGLLGQRAEKIILQDAAKVAEREQALKELVAEGASPEEAENMLRVQKMPRYSTKSTAGDYGATLHYESLGSNQRQATRAETQLGPGYKVQIGEAMKREGIAGNSVEELAESAEAAQNRIVDTLKIRDDIKGHLDMKEEYVQALKKADNLRRMPFSNLAQDADAAQMYADEIAKAYGFKEELLKGPKPPKLPPEPNYEKLARKEVGRPEPVSPRRDIEKELEKGMKRPGFFNRAAVEEELRKEFGLHADEGAVKRAADFRAELHDKSIADWNRLEERYMNTANSKAKLVEYEKAMQSWTGDMDAAIDLLKEQHDRKVHDIIADYVKKSEDSLAPKMVSLQDALQFRKNMDTVFRAKGTFSPEKINLRNAVRVAARNGLEKRIMNTIAGVAKETGDRQLYDQVAVAKQRMVEVGVIQSILRESKGRYASHRILSLGDKILGAAGSHVGAAVGSYLGPVGAMLGGVGGGAAASVASKFARTHGVPALGDYLYKNAGADIGAAERLLEARNVVHADGMRLDNAARKAVQDVQVGGKRALFKENDSTMYRKAEALVEKLQDPKALQQFVERRIGLLTSEAPMFATSYATRVATAVHYLQSQMPKDRPPENMLQAHLEKPRAPNDMELARFARVLHAIDKPMEILDLMGRNRLSRDAVQAVKAVYPGIYQEMRDKLIENVGKAKKPLSYDKLLQLGIMFDAPLLPSMDPKAVNAFQLEFPPTESLAATAGVNPLYAVSKRKQGPGRPPGTGASPHSTVPPMRKPITANFGTVSQSREGRR